MNIFETATRQKLRFDTSKGLLSLEDLWDLPLISTVGRTCLDQIALDLYKELKGASDIVSFVDDKAASNPALQLRFDLVKHVIEHRKKENAEAANAKAKAEMKQQLLAALAKKREGAMDTLTEEDLLKKLAEL